VGDALSNQRPPPCKLGWGFLLCSVLPGESAYLSGFQHFSSGANPAVFGSVLYRILVHVGDRRGRANSLVLTIVVLFLNELWNYGFFGLESTLVGFLGIVVFLVPLTTLVVALRNYERFSAMLVAVYWIWVLYDLAWTYELWILNSVA
jgi:tryptophan-rich sensory protein